MTAQGDQYRLEQRLAEIRGTRDLERAPNVRVLAAYARHVDCPLATLAFVSRVDLDRLLINTRYAAPFGQSPFAYMRGMTFERRIRQGGYGETIRLLRERMGFDITDARIVNLRDGYPPNDAGMVQRAHITRTMIKQILRGDRNAPNIMDGAVLETTIAGVRAKFEADALAARFLGPIHAGEIKSFPVVDGRADGDKVGQALDQVSVYILLARRLVDELGGNPDSVVRQPY